MIAGLDELQRFSGSEDSVALHREALEIRLRHDRRAGICEDQCFDGAFAIAFDPWEDLLRDREDVTRGFVRSPVIKDAHFARPRRIALEQHWRGDCREIVPRGFHRCESTSHRRHGGGRALTDVRLEDESRQFEAALAFDVGQALAAKRSTRRCPVESTPRLRDPPDQMSVSAAGI
jgi:hypothetical protein